MFMQVVHIVTAMHRKVRCEVQLIWSLHFIKNKSILTVVSSNINGIHLPQNQCMAFSKHIRICVPLICWYPLKWAHGVTAQNIEQSLPWKPQKVYEIIWGRDNIVTHKTLNLRHSINSGVFLYSKLSLIWSNPDRNMKMLFTVEYIKKTNGIYECRWVTCLFRQNLTVSSNLHYYVQKQVQLLSLLSMNKCIVVL
jgi:hypothetical protein